ncbi:two-component sensor histidine kinase [Helicobacter valdiviensis]|uniref:histidine kinase n=1 Tax=Helicobacter valdiviensis TaxID=1458358 RepID=A0A2W6MZA9_9HELI|nr:HAMP domain-containing sensor histidine kinase [Helicobacter valdiviensis]PZT48678.1 two-component sensor histidine kinase [Helicobacter valdiviensis]
MALRFFGASLEDKARILVFNIACGLLSLAVVSYVFYFSLKNDFDVLFSSYSQNTIYLEQMRKFIISDSKEMPSQEVLDKNMEQIQMLWHNAEGIHLKYQENFILEQTRKAYLFFLSQEESGYYYKVLDKEKYYYQKLHQKILAYVDFLKTYSLKDTDFNLRLKNIAKELNLEISNVISSSLEVAIYQKKRSDLLHNILLVVVFVIMCLIMLITLLLSFVILKHIKNLHAVLEIRIKEKTKELQMLNDSLQDTIAKEVLESRKKDQIMYQQARLASMGEMIQNIAHQWRQPLNALILLIQAFRVKSQNGKLTQEFVETQVEDGMKIAKQMSRTIEDFRSFFHQSSQKEQFNLKELIDETIALISPILKQNEIHIQIDCPKDIQIYGLKSSLSQVILNLVKNSQDALKSREIKPAEIYIVAYEFKENLVKIECLDNAGGIKLSDIHKIFEPYFTTKHKSIGTGIGLYMSKQIIEKQMQGSIEVQNMQWKGVDCKFCEEGACLKECQSEAGVCGAQFTITIPKDGEI